MLLKSIVSASCLSTAKEKADCNFKQALFKNGMQFGRNGIEWDLKCKNISDENIKDDKKDSEERLWFVEIDENGKIIPKKLNHKLMTCEEAKAYALSLIFN